MMLKSQADMNADLKADLKAELKRTVLAAVRGVPSGVRADARSDTRTLFLTTLALSVGLFLVSGGLSHSAGRPRWFLVTSLATWSAVAALSARGAWRWGGSFVAGSGMQLATVAVGTPALLLAVSLALGRLWPGTGSADTSAGALPCLALTFAAAAYPLAGMLTLRRSTDPLHPIAGGASPSAASGACGGVMVTWWCPLSDAAHVLSAHVLPVAALAIIGAVAGDRMLAMRLTRRRSRGVPARGVMRKKSGKKGNIAKRFVSCDVTPGGIVPQTTARDPWESAEAKIWRRRAR
jgi:hypothetical protein